MESEGDDINTQTPRAAAVARERHTSEAEMDLLIDSSNIAGPSHDRLPGRVPVLATQEARSTILYLRLLTHCS